MERCTGRAIILSGGEPFENVEDVIVPDHTMVIAADSGLHHAEGLALTVDLIIGDMDSVDPSALAKAVERGATVVRYPTDKDRTDLELAVDAAIEHGACRITIIGAHTGRLDHLLGAMGFFAVSASRVEELIWIDGAADVIACVAGRPITVAGETGDRVSLIPTGSDVRGITTGGLHWELDDETLSAGSTRGISNIIESAPVWVRTGEGTLLVVHERKST